MEKCKKFIILKYIYRGRVLSIQYLVCQIIYSNKVNLLFTIERYTYIVYYSKEEMIKQNHPLYKYNFSVVPPT